MHRNIEPGSFIKKNRTKVLGDILKNRPNNFNQHFIKMCNV